MYGRLLNRDLNNNVGIAMYCPGMCQSYMSSGNGERTSKEGAIGIELLCFNQSLKDDTNAQFWQLQTDNDASDNNKYSLVQNKWDEIMAINDKMPEPAKGAFPQAIVEKFFKPKGTETK